MNKNLTIKNKFISIFLSLIISIGIAFISLFLYAVVMLEIWQYLRFPNTEFWQNTVPIIGMFEAGIIGISTFIYFLKKNNDINLKYIFLSLSIIIIFLIFIFLYS